MTAANAPFVEYEPTAIWTPPSTPARTPDPRSRRRPRREDRPTRPATTAATAGTAATAAPDLPTPTPAAPVPDAPRREREHEGWRWPAWSLVIPVAGATFAVILVAASFFAADQPGGGDVEVPAATAEGGGTVEAFGAPVVQPVGQQVTVGLAAQEDASVRVTVDGVVQFNGVLQDGERQSWEGKERIQVWTDKGKTLLIAINGVDYGEYSPAMGHADWNRIDFAFWPGWGG